jgi:hypothetical protein
MPRNADSWRARCGESRTPGSAGGVGRPAEARRPAPTQHTDDEKGRRERFLAALIMMALPGDLAADLPLPEDAARLLTPEARRALGALGRDLVARIVRGGGAPKAPPAPPAQTGP